MKLKDEPKDVDIYIKSRQWSEEEFKEVSEFIKQRKAVSLAREKRRTRLKKAKPANYMA